MEITHVEPAEDVLILLTWTELPVHMNQDEDRDDGVRHEDRGDSRDVTD